jgi:GxxExxY protein
MKCRYLTGRIHACFYEVYNELGFGFLEKVYERAMLVELKSKGLHCVSQQPIPVFYRGNTVGEYFADILVENEVIIELKAATSLMEAHECQLINYLKATEIEVGLLLNFGPKPQFKRKIFDIKNPSKPV